MNLYVDGIVTTESEEGRIAFETRTAYPVHGKICLTVKPEKPAMFTLALRIPAWSKETKLLVNGKEIAVTEGYTEITRQWKNGDLVELSLDMRTKALYPISYKNQILVNRPCWKANYIATTYDVEHPEARNHIALQRGPLILAQDGRLGYDLSTSVPIKIRDDGCVDVVIAPDQADFPHLLQVRVPLSDGTEMELVDYASAGKTWTDSSRMAAWIRVH